MFYRRSLQQLFGSSHTLLKRQITTPARENSIQRERWDLFAGVLVERLPVVSKALNPLEQQFQELLWRVEYEKSLKSSHELQHEQDLRYAESIKKGQVEVDLEEGVTKQTAQDLKDSYLEEAKKFHLAPRITPADKANDLTHTNRCLEDTLYLLVAHKIGQKMQFLLPQGKRLNGETMRQTAERVLRERCGNALQVQFYGNAPWGFYKYKYPIEVRKSEHSVGAKVFFYRAVVQQGNVDKSISGGYEWLVKDALNTKLKANGPYAESIHKFLV